MTPLEKSLLWLAYEDCTGLWQAVFEVADQPDNPGPKGSPVYARQVIGALLDRGWIDLFTAEGPLSDQEFQRVPAEQRRELLDSDASWVTPDDEDGVRVWFGTTDEGFEAHRLATNWM